MRRTKQLILVSLASAGAFMALLVTAVLIAHLMANRGMVKDFIVAKTAQVTDGQLDYDRLTLSLFPYPHLVVRNIRLNRPDDFVLQAGELSLFPRIQPLLSGRFSIRRLLLVMPEIRVRMGSAAEPVPPPAVEPEGKPLATLVKERLGGLFGALAAIDPETQVQIQHGAAVFVLPDGSMIRITALQATAVNRANRLSLDLSCASNLTGRLTIDATADVGNRRLDGTISLADADLRQVFSLLPLPGGVTTAETRVGIDLDFAVEEPDTVQAGFRVNAPSLTIVRNDRSLALTAARLSGSLSYVNGEMSLAIDTLAARQPAVELSAAATLWRDAGTGTTHLRLSAGTEEVDVAMAGDVCRAIAGDLPAIRTAFAVARSGRLATPTYHVSLEHDATGWHLGTMEATGRLTRGQVTIPGIAADLNTLSADVALKDSHVMFSKASGLFKGAAFRNLAAAIDWEKQATLSIKAPSVRIDAEPFYAWLTGFDALGEAKRYVQALTGRVAVSKLGIDGPLTDPEKWALSIVGAPEDLRLTIPWVPSEVKLSGGEIAYQPGNERSSGVRVDVLDGVFVSSHQSTGIDHPKTVAWQIDGTMGPETIAWLNTILPIPDHLQIKPPVHLSGIDIRWQQPDRLTVSGEVKTAGGVTIYADAGRTPDAWQIRELRFSDGASKATLSANKQDTAVELAFSGAVEKEAADRLLRSNQTLAGRIEGDFRARIDMDRPLESSFIGRLSGNGLQIRHLTRSPIDVNTFAINGYGKRVDVAPTEISLAGHPLRVAGTVDAQGSDPTFDLTVDADRLDEALFQALQPLAESGGTAGGVKPAARITPRGRIHMQANDLVFGGFTWSPVNADVEVAAGGARIMVNQAVLCGISTTGRLDVSSQGIGLDIMPSADGASLQETVDCLWHKPISADARYTLSGALHLPPTKEKPSQAISGAMTVSSENGRIRYSNTLMKVFSVLNVTEVFTGGRSDLAEDGYGYSRAHATAVIGNGNLRLEEILLDGNSLTITGQGDIDLNNKTADILLLAAPLKTVDRIVNRIPLINYITGGSLISVPLRVHGDLDNLSVVPVPPSAVGRGLLNFMERTLKAPFKLVEKAVDSPSTPATGGAPPPTPNP